jgi:hypothetical protein
MLHEGRAQVLIHNAVKATDKPDYQSHSFWMRWYQHHPWFFLQG